MGEQGYNGLVLGSLNKKIPLDKHPCLRSWITILDCISATGGSPNLVVFKEQSVQQHWFTEKIRHLL